jgi:putative integral membrane protein (TIGR02587 family)
MASSEQVDTPRAHRNDRPVDGSEAERAERHFLRAMLHASGGALIFSLPTLMTMEMWQLGFHIDPLRLALFMALVLPLLVGLAYYAGFEENFSWVDIVLDAFVAYAIGFAISAVLLLLMAIIGPGMAAHEIVGKIAVQAAPGSIGAMLANILLGGGEKKKQQKRRWASYQGNLFLAAAGALFVAFSLSSTEEMVLVAYKMTEWHAIALVVASLLIVGGFVYAVESPGRGRRPRGSAAPVFGVQLRYGVVGYVIALLISAYILWTFGRSEGTSAEQFLMAVIVLGFPASVGAGASRLIL